MHFFLSFENESQVILGENVQNRNVNLQFSKLAR